MAASSAEATRPDESRLLAALRAGDAAAFARVVDEFSPGLLRLARASVRSPALAEDVVQETWVKALRALDRFEGRASLRTWLTTILLNTARTRGKSESRTIPFSALARDEDDGGPTVDPDRFLPAGHRWAGHWAAAPEPLPEEQLEAEETRALIEAAIAALPERQRLVITLRDVEGWGSVEVRNVLELTESNQRVLLHRARSKVRQALEDELT